MPGLLQVPDGEAHASKFLSALVAEFLGTAIFSLYGSATTLQGTTNSSLNNALGNGFALSVIVYITANVSGAHINPAVTLAAAVTGYISAVKALVYVICQVAGGILGSLLLVALVRPAAELGVSNNPSGCFAKADINSGQLFGWELILTFTLVMTVFAVAISEPSFGNSAPLGVGLALLAGVQAAGKYTGGSLNPARSLGPSCVFVCNWSTTWIYVLAELAGGLLAGLANIPLYGTGPVLSVKGDMPPLPTTLQPVPARWSSSKNKTGNPTSQRDNNQDSPNNLARDRNQIQDINQTQDIMDTTTDSQVGLASHRV